jgi:PhzF family phenazine biosynthesis protein
MKLHYQLFDVFVRANGAPLSGNPLAVFDMPEAITTTQQQLIANWLNFSESTFLTLAADSKSYIARIYTPKRELPFAGHPTLGSYAAMLPKLAAGAGHIQHCGAGALPVWAEQCPADTAPIYWVQAPTAKLSEISAEHQRALQNALGSGSFSAPARNVNNGPIWTVIQLASTEHVLALRPNSSALAAANTACGSLGAAVFAFGSDAQGDYLESRCFVPLDDILEDPVTGSGNAAIAAFVFRQRQQSAGKSDAFELRARQGRALGRDGELFLRIDATGGVLLGGRAREVASGTFEISIDQAKVGLS